MTHQADNTNRVTDLVREFYTSYPYPDPRVSAIDVTTSSAMLDFVKSLYWPFRTSLSGVRVLDAGCGTGIGALSTAARHPQVEVIGIDLSTASLELARGVATQRGLKNLTFRQGSLLDASDHGHFQYIISSGVVHHMADPVAGLRALREALTPDGVLMGMVYAQYGRSGVYLLQDAFRRLAPSGNRTIGADAARAIATSLAADHPFDRRRFLEMDWKEDCGVVDLLLHPQDRAFTVPQLVDACGQAGLRLTRFIAPHAYEPASYSLPVPEHERAASMPRYERWALGELLHGRMVKHEFYATRDAFTPIAIKAEGAILMGMRIKRSPTWNWASILETPADGGPSTYQIKEWVSSDASHIVTLQKWQIDLVRRFDGQATALEVFKHRAVQKSIPGQDPDAKLRLYCAVVQTLVTTEMLLADPS
jgi:SAM-dependent methyltransferase